jgi:hypothetical protein
MNKKDASQVKNTTETSGGDTSKEKVDNINEVQKTQEIPEVFPRDPALTQMLEDFVGEPQKWQLQWV